MKKHIIKLCMFLALAFNLYSDDYKLETLVQKKNATLDLTVKKISSQPLNGVVDRKSKTVLIEITEDNHIYLTENLNDLSLVSVTGKNNNYNKVINYNSNLLTGKEVIDGNLTYKVYNFSGKKIVSLKYKVEPNNLYVGIIQKNGGLKKVYNIDFIEDTGKKFDYLGLIVETPETMNFTKELIDSTRSKTVSSTTQVIVKNPTFSNLALKLKESSVSLTNGSSNLNVDSFNIEKKDNFNNDPTKSTTIFTLKGNINKDDLAKSTTGKYKGTAYLDLYIQ